MKRFVRRLKPAVHAAVKFLESSKARPAELAAARFAFKHLVASGVLSAAAAAAIEYVVR